jgi:3-carboxy-cis,cis-muconate cycloisomerase
MSTHLIDSLATTGALAAVFSDAAILQAMLDFEIALARAEAQAGVIPAKAAESIARAAGADAFDAHQIAIDARASATIAIPFVKALRARVATIDADAARYVHWGATSQDVVDTALVRCIAHAGRVLDADHARLARALTRTSEAHAGTVMLGRTLLQPALPITFGLKAAGWLGAVTRNAARLFAAVGDVRVLQFGGAAGTLAALGDHGPAVERALAGELGLAVPDAPWHAHRDRLAALVASCGVYTGTLGKIARDVSLLMQDEVGEAAEPGGGSSTMPQKRNPAGCAAAIAAATRVPGLVASFLSGMAQEHERGVGGWQAEGPTVVATIQATGAALSAVGDVVEGLSVSADRMRANIAATHGVIFAEKLTMLIVAALGRDEAATLAAHALRQSRDSGRPLREVVASMPEIARVLSPEQIASLDVPESYLGSAEAFRRRLVEAAARRKNM